MWDKTSICIMRVKEAGREKGAEKNIWKNKVEKFPNLMKMIIPNINCMNICPIAHINLYA